MPLENAKAGSPGFSRNVSTEVKASKPVSQAVAIAYSKAGERKDAHAPSNEDQRYAVKIKTPTTAWRLETYVNGKEAADKKAQSLRSLGYEVQVSESGSSHKDGTEAVTGMPMNIKLDEAIRAADAFYSRADAMQTGRWERGKEADCFSKIASSSSPQASSHRADPVPRPAREPGSGR